MHMISQLYIKWIYFIIWFFSKKIRWLFLFVHQKSWKLAFNTGFSVHNIHLYFCSQVENTKWILCRRKMVLNVQYLRFLIYKIIIFYPQLISIILPEKKRYWEIFKIHLVEIILLFSCKISIMIHISYIVRIYSKLGWKRRV